MAVGCARLAVGPRRVVRVVTATAGGVPRHQVKRGQRIARMAARAHRWRGDAGRPVSPVARRAASLDAAMRSSRLLRVARNARRRRRDPRRVRFVAAIARGMSRRSCRLLFGVATSARRRSRRSVGQGRPVTRCAVGMTRVGGGERDLARVAGRAERRSVDARKTVRTMARLARGSGSVGGCVGLRDVPVATRAG